MADFRYKHSFHELMLSDLFEINENLKFINPHMTELKSIHVIPVL